MKWNRNLGTSKREQGVPTVHRKPTGNPNAASLTGYKRIKHGNYGLGFSKIAAKLHGLAARRKTNNRDKMTNGKPIVKEAG